MNATTTTTTDPTILGTVTEHEETYRGRRIALLARTTLNARYGSDADGNSLHRDSTRKWAEIDRQSIRRPTGTDEQAVSKLRKVIDTQAADAELLSALVGLILVGGHRDKGVTAPAVGDIAGTYAMGRVRRGVITKVSRTRVEIAYTTASSNGRVFRKMTAFDEAYIY
jgi:hypothetical protein